MYLLFIFLCIMPSLYSIFIGQKLSNLGNLLIFILTQITTLLISIYIFYEVCILKMTCYIDLLPWITINNFLINWSFLFDSLSSLMLVVILSISFCANIYSLDYMDLEPYKIRFFCYLSMFTFTMILLVTANNLIQLFLGWELVGITSYLLINYWYTRLQANKSAILAIFANKLGDIFLLFLALWLYYLYNNLDFYTLFICNSYNNDLYIKFIYNLLDNWENINVYFFSDTFFSISKSSFYIWSDYNYFIISFSSINTICFFILLASICKSAQSGFHFWLAEAMEGPTPVSSLLHAATMVTAGIFLTTRCNTFFYTSYGVPIYIIFIGATTSLFASLIGYFQNDLKKIVAYSTCSQLGYMFCATGISSYDYAMFHLFNHAFFKALLFLSSGYIIHICSDEQNIRHLGGLIKILPLPYICLLIGSLSLIGLPFFSGFFSKDLIVEKLAVVHYLYIFNLFYYNLVYISQFFLFVSLLLTIKYSVRLIFYVFLNQYNGSFIVFHFSSYKIILPLFFLCFLSIISGYLFSDLMVGLGSFFWGDLFNNTFFFEKILPINDKYYNFLLGDLPFEFNKYIFFSIYAFVIYYIISSSIYYSFIDTIYNFFYIPFDKLKCLFININNKFLIFNRFFIKNIIFLLYNESYKETYQFIDKQLIEYIGPFGVISLLWSGNKFLSKVSSGLIYHYSGILNLFIISIFTLLSLNII